MSVLRNPVTNLSASRDEIVAALEWLFMDFELYGLFVSIGLRSDCVGSGRHFNSLNYPVSRSAFREEEALVGHFPLPARRVAPLSPVHP